MLITHTPPAGVLDRTSGGRHCGCPDLLARVEQVGPSIHCFGHVHASAGRLVRGPTKFVNAAVVDGSYRIARAPCVLQL